VESSTVLAMAAGMSAKSCAISFGVRRWRSLLRERSLPEVESEA